MITSTKKSLALTDTLFSPCFVDVNLFYAGLLYNILLLEILSHYLNFIGSSVTVRWLTENQIWFRRTKWRETNNEFSFWYYLFCAVFIWEFTCQSASSYKAPCSLTF